MPNLFIPDFEKVFLKSKAKQKQTKRLQNGEKQDLKKCKFIMANTTHTHTHMHTYIHAHTHTHTNTTLTHACMHAGTHTCTHTHTQRKKVDMLVEKLVHS